MSWIARLFIVIAICNVSGCFTSTRQENVASEKTEERVGIESGQPTQLTITTRERVITDSNTQSGIDVAKAITAAMAGFKGDFLTAIAQLKPSDPKPMFDGTTGGIAAGAASLGLLALREFMARRQAQRDAEEEWKRANANHDRAESYAKQLPPATAQTTTTTQ
jgi:hypothetical protein